MASSAAIEPFFLRTGSRSVLCVYFRAHPSSERQQPILHVPALCEEMNKARRMVSCAARRMADAGHPVLLLDPTGTGDSSHDFGEAAWDVWRDDVIRCAGWLEEHTGRVPTLWGLRAGCLLIDSVLSATRATRVAFWQPVLSGESALTQLLRLRSFGDFAGAGQRRESVKELLAMLEAGQRIDVAGYTLSPELAVPLRKVRLGGTQYRGTSVAWLETVPTSPAALSPASDQCIASLFAFGARVSVRAVNGLAFWMTQEIAECQALIDATVAELKRL